MQQSYLQLGHRTLGVLWLVTLQYMSMVTVSLYFLVKWLQVPHNNNIKSNHKSPSLFILGQAGIPRNTINCNNTYNLPLVVHTVVGYVWVPVCVVGTCWRSSTLRLSKVDWRPCTCVPLLSLGGRTVLIGQNTVSMGPSLNASHALLDTVKHGSDGVPSQWQTLVMLLVVGFLIHHLVPSSSLHLCCTGHCASQSTQWKLTVSREPGFKQYLFI